MKKNPYSIIKRPVITEKSTDLREASNQIVFEVARNANKVEIRQAIEALFKVKVLQVQTMKVVGKMRKVGKSSGQKSDWKKAIVKLKAGDSIPIFEGA